MRRARLVLEVLVAALLALLLGLMAGGWQLQLKPDRTIESDPLLLPGILLLAAAGARLALGDPLRWRTLDALAAVLNRALEAFAAWAGRRPRPLVAAVLALPLVVYVAAWLACQTFGLHWRAERSGESDPFPPVEMRVPNAAMTSPELRRHLYQARDFRSKWTGYLYVPDDDRYVFETYADGFTWLRLDGNLIQETWNDWRFEAVRTEPIALAKGCYAFELEYWDGWLNSAVSLRWDDGSGTREIPSILFGRAPITGGDYLRRVLLVRVRQIAGVLAFVSAVLAAGLAIRQGTRRTWLERPRARFAAVAALTLTGAVLRLWILLDTHGMLLGDEAIVGIAALRILRGEWPLIYYGQPYGGLFESYLAAPLLKVFGPSALTVKMVPFALGVALIPLAYALGKRFYGAAAGLLAAAYVAMPPVMNTIYSLMMLVGPVEIPLFGAAMLLLAARLGEGQLSLPREALLSALLGALTGFAFWIHGQILYFAFAVALYLLLKRHFGVLRSILWAGFAGLAAGMAPLLLHNCQNDWETFRFLFGDMDSSRFYFISYWNSFRAILLNRCLPAILGGTVRWKLHENLALGLYPVMVYGIALALFLWALAAAAGRWGRAKAGFPEPRDLPILLLLVTAFVFVFSKFGRDSEAATGMPRYLYAAFPVIAVLFGAGVATAARKAPLLGGLLAVPVFVLHLGGHAITDNVFYFQPMHFLANVDLILPTDNRPMLDFLREKQLTRVYADYWIGSPFIVESGEAILVDSERDRLPQYADQVRHSWNPVYLFHTNMVESRELDHLFNFMGWPREAAFLPYILRWAPGNIPPRAQWSVTAYDGIEASAAIDGDITYFGTWVTPEPQRAGMYLRIDLGEPVKVHGVAVYSGGEQESWGRPADGAVRAELFTSLDGQDFQLRGAFDNNPHCKANIAILGEEEVRYLHIGLAEGHPVRHWCVRDVFVW